MTDRTRYLLAQRTWTNHTGAVETAPVLINLDHVRHAQPAPNGDTTIWWAHEGLTPMNLAMDFNVFIAHVIHHDPAQE